MVQGTSNGRGHEQLTSSSRSTLAAACGHMLGAINLRRGRWEPCFVAELDGVGLGLHSGDSDDLMLRKAGHQQVLIMHETPKAWGCRVGARWGSPAGSQRAPGRVRA